MTTNPDVTGFEPLFGVRIAGQVPDTSRVARLSAPIVGRSTAEISDLLDQTGHLVTGLSLSGAEEVCTALSVLGLEVIIDTPPQADHGDGTRTEPIQGLSALSRGAPAQRATIQPPSVDAADLLVDADDAPDDDEPTTVFDVEPLGIAVQPPQPGQAPPRVNPSSEFPAVTAVPDPWRQPQHIRPEPGLTAPSLGPAALVVERPTERREAPSARNPWLFVAVLALVAAIAGVLVLNHGPSPLELVARAQAANAAGDYPHALTQLGLARAAGAPDQLVRALERAAQTGPLADAGQQHLQAGRYLEAEAVLASAEKIAPGDARLLMLRVNLERAKAAARTAPPAAHTASEAIRLGDR